MVPEPEMAINTIVHLITGFRVPIKPTIVLYFIYLITGSLSLLIVRTIWRDDAVKYSPKIGQLVKLVKTLKSSSQYEAEAQKIQP